MPELTTTFLDLVCPYCKAKLDASTYTGFAERRPKAGESISVCAECVAVSIYMQSPSGLVLEPFDIGKLDAQQQAEIRKLQVFLRERRPQKN